MDKRKYNTIKIQHVTTHPDYRFASLRPRERGANDGVSCFTGNTAGGAHCFDKYFHQDATDAVLSQHGF